MDKRMLLIGAVCLALAGCTTQGRLSIMDLDFRKPAQIAAGAVEAEAPYKDYTCGEQDDQAPVVEAKALPGVWWTALFDMIAKLECRITLLQIEWADKPGVQK